MATTGRPRAMSGTIPSMETAHDALKDNTVIVGPCSLSIVYASAPD